MDYPLLECENNVKRSRVKNILTNLRIFLEEKIDSVLNEPQSSLLAGILFGSKRLLEKNFEEGVRIAGVSHIVSASGYNITVLSMSLSKVTSFLSKKKRIILSLIVIWLFAIFSGFSASIVRACIMSSLSFVAKLFGRDSSMHVALPLTAVIFLIMEPLIIFDAGFLLSLSAMIGLIYIQPILEKVLPTSSFVKENILSTMSCTISTLPISIFFFKTLSIWSVPANVLILPVVGSTMIFGILGLASAKFVSEISYFFFTIVNLQLKYFELIVMKIQSLGFGAFNIADQYALPLLFILLFVFIIVVIYFYPIKNEQYNYYLKKS
ncbi:MAG: ComEC/Rec2 family competence protein [Candidatus Dojkabacteria bacterium]|jgi:competence protein ComEC